jgi:hypothetical protein
MVKKKGIYRISEVKECSATDYDFWKGSNVYKGYGEENKAAKNIMDGGTDGYVIFAVSDVKADQFKADTVTDTENEDKKYYRPTASFTNSETVFAYLTSQSYAENKIGRSEEGAG